MESRLRAAGSSVWQRTCHRSSCGCELHQIKVLDPVAAAEGGGATSRDDQGAEGRG